MLKTDSNDTNVNSDDSTNTEGEELDDQEVNKCKIRTSNLLHSILTEGTQGSFSGSIYQPTLRGFERMTVTDKNEEQKSITSTGYSMTVPVLTISQDADLENGIDFGYSQKFFHIADGNLYSVFSPLQGRSYGGKPSFLRKQRCTIRESQGRGRKSLKRGLKFHNFLPSESITSEKEDKIVTGEGETWKVHAECRLREEHGTKQIMVSNWSVSGGNLSETLSTDDNVAEKEDHSLLSVTDVTQPDHISKRLLDINTHLLQSREKPICVDSRDSEKGTELKAIVERLVMIPHKITKSPLDVPTNANLQSGSRRTSLRSKRNSKGTSSEENVFYNNGKNNGRDEQSITQYQHSRRQRRKPLQTKKIVPYDEYLTMLEENNSKPLDLSYQAPFSSSTNLRETLHTSLLEEHSTLPDAKNREGIDQSSFTPINFHTSNSIQMPILNKEYSSETIASNSAEAATDSKKSLVLLNPCVNICENSSPSSVTYVCPVSLFLGQQPSSSKDIHDDDKLISSLNKMSQISEICNSSSNLTIAPQAILNTNPITNSRIKISNEAQRLHVSKPRGRSNQRTMIRKKLEDTFRQNGFLVKTKQVTDGEATFCKFRQLRKYTRHYLKSWHHHLPEEVHKLWKGFLPSKTALPPSTGGKIALTKELSSLNSLL